MMHALKRWLPILILILSLVAFFYFHLYTYLTFTAVKQHRDMLLTWTNDHYFFAVLLFMLLYIIAVSISIPGAIFFTLVGGFLFGALFGTIYVVISATLGALVVFLAVRTALEPWIAKKAKNWIEKMRQGFQKNAVQYMLVLRLIPLFPFWVVNIVPAILGVRTSVFVVTTLVGIIPGSFIYVLLGSSLGELFDQNRTPDLHIIFAPKILIPLIALAILLFLPTIYKAIKRNSR